MTFTPVGSLITGDTPSFNITTTTAGDLVLLAVGYFNGDSVPTSVSGGGCTWEQIGTTVTPTTAFGGAGSCAVFAGTVTTPGTAALTITSTGTTGNLRCDGFEFASSVGSWSLDTQGILDSTGTSDLPSLTPAAAGELYFAFEIDGASFAAGSTPGYTYTADPHGNGLVFNAACTSAVQAPQVGDGTAQLGIALLVKESGGTSAPNTVTLNAWQNSQVGTVGVANSLAFTATDSDPTETLTWTSTTLPDGMGINSSTGEITGTPTTVQSLPNVTVTATDSTGASGSITFVWTITANSGNAGWPDITFGTSTTDSNGVITWPVTTGINGGGSGSHASEGSAIRVLQPASPSSEYPHGILVVMPESGGIDNTSVGNGFDTIQTAGAQNTYNFTLVEPSFTTDPFYADNPLDTSVRLETYLLEVIAWAKATYGTTGSELVYVIGFSKAGFGVQALLFRHPDIIHAGAAWDSMFAMTDIEGDDPAGNDPPAGNSAYCCGTDANFQANYQLSSANITRWIAGKNFTTVKRTWVGGYSEFPGDVTQYEALLDSLGVQADHSWSKNDSHAWHSDWVSAALASMLTAAPAPASSGLLMAGII